MTYPDTLDEQTRQLTDACWKDVTNSKTWTGFYDVEGGDIEPNHEGRVQLSIFVCAPFGEYELMLDVNSYTEDPDSRLQQRTAWTLENGDEEVLPCSNTYGTHLHLFALPKRLPLYFRFPNTKGAISPIILSEAFQARTFW